MSANNIRSSRALLHEKRVEIANHMEKFAPTVIVSRPEGVYVLSPEIEKVYTTIVLAGAGTSFMAIADWFRAQISQLVIEFGRNTPDAAVEGKRLLSRVFEPNLQFSRSIVYADIVVVEIKEEPLLDKIFHLNFLRQWEVLRGGQTHCVSYKTLQRLVRQSSDAKNESKFVSRETEEKIKREREEFQIPDAENRDLTENELERLLAAYPHGKAMLNREKYVAKKYDWVYRTI